MKPIGDRIEQQIKEAMERGDFENLPGAGKPFELHDDTFVPDDMKVAFRMLKNANVVPPEVVAHQELHALRTKFAEDTAMSPAEREQFQQKIILKETQLNIALERLKKRS